MTNYTGAKIPSPLVESMKSQRVILFLGAGASMEAGAPSGDQLRERLARKFFGADMKGYDLMSVAEMAISAHGNASVFEFIRLELEQLEPSDAHKLLPTFRWRTIATTNYDLLIERAYMSVPSRLQTPVSFVRDTEPVEERLQRVRNSVELIKLHGSVDDIHDPNLPPILSNEHYYRYSANRTRLFARLEDRAREWPILFCGYRISDPHIRNLIYKFSEIGTRPRYYVVSPGLADPEISFWASKNVEVINSRFGEFIKALDRAVPPLFRNIDLSGSPDQLPIRRFYRVNSIESDVLRDTLSKDLLLVRQDMPYQTQDPKKFYEGYDMGWGAIAQSLDVQRRLVDDLIFKAVLEESSDTESRFFVLKGPGGSGKTIALKRCAWNISTQFGALALWLERSGALNAERLSELYELTGRRIYLFIDRVALNLDRVNSALRYFKQRKLPITLMCAERDTEWNVYCAPLEAFAPEDIRVGQLSTGEIEGLLDLLQRHNSLGLLSIATRAQQIAAFKEGADRQLLVALHEATRGKRFEDIVYEEYQGIVSSAARQLYLDIATMNQFSVLARAGTISRVSGIRFEDYERDFFYPLENVILSSTDPYTGDYNYRTRHSRVAEFVFRKACPTDEEKSDQFVRIIGGLDAGYSSDRNVLLGILRGRSVAEAIGDVEAGRAIYAAAVRAAPTQAHTLQQWAIFELHHRHGSLQRSEELARKAREMDPSSNAIIHTQSEVARRRANGESSVLLKAQFRKQARERLDEIRPQASCLVASSRCKLSVDEVRDLAAAISDATPENELAFFTDKVKDTESRIQRAAQAYPEDADIPQIEASFRETINETGLAVRSLERAFKLGPRGVGVAIRLARAYVDQNKITKAREVIDEALIREPEDKQLHYEMAKFLLQFEPDETLLIGRHLLRSYSTGDQNFDARHLNAQYFFWQGKPEESLQLFLEISKIAPKDWRFKIPMTDSLISKRLGVYNGSVVFRDPGYLFIKCAAFPRDIFGHQSQASPDDWEGLQAGHEVNFRVRFNRFGPVAIDMKTGRQR
jgi:tetratricopeptide (TPR) repeat protein